jgi:hypothetical protein
MSPLRGSERPPSEIELVDLNYLNASKNSMAIRSIYFLGALLLCLVNASGATQLSHPQESGDKGHVGHVTEIYAKPAQINRFRSYVSATLPEEVDQQLIYDFLRDLSQKKISGGLTIRGPKQIQFYIGDWQTLGMLAPDIPSSKNLPPNMLAGPKKSSPATKMLFSQGQIQPVGLKRIQIPLFSPINGHRIATLKIQSIATIYKNFGPFKVPTPGYKFEAAELILTKP